MPEILSKYIECYVYRKLKNGIKYLILKRSSEKYPFPGIWQIVTGRFEDEEKAYETAFREVKEETGLTPVKFFVAPRMNEFYTPHNDKIYLIPVFVAEVEDDKIVLSGEHTDFKWVKYKKAFKKIHWYSQKENLKVIDDILTGKIENTMIQITDIK